MWKLDISTFFLYGKLDRPIYMYMKQPPGYEVGKENDACMLPEQKSVHLYSYM